MRCVPASVYAVLLGYSALAQLKARYTKDVVKKEADALQREIRKCREIMESGKQ
jgi:hypothetical protein